MPLDKFTRKAWQIHELSGSGKLLGDAPYTQDGFRRSDNSLIGDTYEPIGAKTYAAKQDEYNYHLQQKAMGLEDPNQPWYSKTWGTLKDLGKWGVNTPVARGATWILNQLDRVPNALEGALENTRDQALTSGHALPFGETMKAAGQGLKQGFLEQKDYNFGRWLEKLDPNSNTWQDIMRARPLRMAGGAWDRLTGKPGFLSQSVDEMRGRSGPQPDAQYSGLTNMTNADIMSLLFNIKTTVTPKLGRFAVPKAAGEAAAVTEDFTPKKFSVKTRTPTGNVDGLLVPRETPPIPSSISSMRGTVSRPLPVPPPDMALKRAFQIDFMGKHFTPFQDAQFKMFDAVGEGARKALSYSPATERFLSHFSNRIESTNTRGAAKAFDVIDNSRQGFQIGVKNFKARMNQAFEGFGVTKGNQLTDAERTLAYYSAVTGKAVDDPMLLKSISTHYKIDPTELLSSTQRAGALRDWWVGEAQQYKQAGEARNLFRGIETDYAPIRFKKELEQQLLANGDDLLGKEFSGLRGIQKFRNFDLTKSWDKLVQHGAAGDLAFDKLDDAANFYNRVYHGLERHQNILGGLEGLGLVSKSPKQGFSDLAKVLEVNPELATATGKPLVTADKYFINDAYKQRFVDELFGYGGGGGINKALKGLSRIQDPWKLMVTTFSPRYHINNALDDVARNYWFGKTGIEDFTAAVSRGTAKAADATIHDWTLSKPVNGLEQWHYTPGTKKAMSLTQEQASNLAQAMGVSTVQTTDEIAKLRAGQGPLGRVKQGVNKFRESLEHLQGAQREANFIGGLRQQGDSSIAKAITDQDLINYRDISPFFRDVVRPFAPFSTFRTKNPGVMLNQMLMNPKQFSQIAAIQKAAEHMHGQFEGQDQLNLPPYYRDKPVFAWKNPTAGKLNILDVGLSQFDAQNLIPGARMGETLRRLPGPAVQIPLGLITGKDSLGQDVGGMKESKWIDGLLFGKKGQDGKKYTSGQLQFIIDSMFGTVADYHHQGETAMDSANRLSHLTGQTYDSDVQSLKVLLEQNRLRQAQLAAIKLIGGQVPSATTLKRPPTNSLLR